MAVRRSTGTVIPARRIRTSNSAASSSGDGMALLLSVGLCTVPAIRPDPLCASQHVMRRHGPRQNSGRRGTPPPATVAAMDTVLDQSWTTETFLAWEDRQEGKHEFDGREIIPMTGGTLAHQRIIGNLW